MKKILILLFTILFCHGISAQNTGIDSLINKLNNRQLYGTCHYIWVLEMDSKEADSLVRIGKSISSKLIPLLDDSEKGIIAHCVLSRIWYNDFKNGSSFEHFESKGIVEYNYNELKFYEKDGKMIADRKELIESKKKWIEKIK